MDKNTLFNVKNRSAGMVVYKLPELGVRREFAPGETKKISYDELEKLTYQSGGRTLMNKYLQINSTQEKVSAVEVLDELNLKHEPEYFMNETQVTELLKNGSMDEFLDCLDFAPAGVIDLIKDIAVKLPLNDIEKRAAILKHTGFNVTAAIEHSKEDVEAAAAATPERRVKPTVTDTGRRTSGEKYNITKIGE